jgi:hypothetical protein
MKTTAQIATVLATLDPKQTEVTLTGSLIRITSPYDEATGIAYVMSDTLEDPREALKLIRNWTGGTIQ